MEEIFQSLLFVADQSLGKQRHLRYKTVTDHSPPKELVIVSLSGSGLREGCRTVSVPQGALCLL